MQHHQPSTICGTTSGVLKHQKGWLKMPLTSRVVWQNYPRLT